MQTDRPTDALRGWSAATEVYNLATREHTFRTWRLRLAVAAVAADVALGIGAAGTLFLADSTAVRVVAALMVAFALTAAVMDTGCLFAVLLRRERERRLAAEALVDGHPAPTDMWRQLNEIASILTAAGVPVAGPPLAPELADAVRTLARRADSGAYRLPIDVV